MHILNVLLSMFTGATCDHCDAEDNPYNDIRLHGLKHPVSCPGNCRLDECDGETGMTDLCEDCYRELVRER